MPTDRDAVTLRFAPAQERPELTPGAARILLRILRKAHDRRAAAQGGSPVSVCERDVA